MKRKPVTEAELLAYMTEYLVYSLDELTSLEDIDGFAEGEITAYLDCMEILSRWNGFGQYASDFAEKYQIK